MRKTRMGMNRTRSARRLNVILGINGAEAGVVEFELFIGNTRALPPGFLRAHCHPCRPWRSGDSPVLRCLYGLCALGEWLCGSIPGIPTHRARFRYAYDPEKSLENNGLHQDMNAAFAHLREAGFVLLGGLGMGSEWCPADCYAWRLSIGAESADFSVLLPSRNRREYVLTTVREMEEAR